jgi:hypothetical protein
MWIQINSDLHRAWVRNTQAKFMLMVKKILRKYGYLPDKQEKATTTVLEQAKLLWGMGGLVGLSIEKSVLYIIYKALEAANLEFKYEEPLSLTLGAKTLTIKPDFTILLPSGRKVYWEHLGELDVKEYSLNWSNRARVYKENGLTDCLLTSDDIDGIRDDSLATLINDLKNNRLAGDTRSGFSEHHYRLYG